MKWVKASERLPGDNGWYFTRYTDMNNILESLHHIDGSWFDKRGTKYGSIGQIEWLDESLTQSQVGNTTQGEEDFEKYPYEGTCGKCGNYKVKLDNHFLCEFCLLMGVKYISMTPEQRKQVEHLVRLRPRPTPTTQSEGEEAIVLKYGEMWKGTGIDSEEKMIDAIYEKIREHLNTIDSLKLSNSKLVEALDAIKDWDEAYGIYDESGYGGSMTKSIRLQAIIDDIKSLSSLSNNTNKEGE